MELLVWIHNLNPGFGFLLTQGCDVWSKCNELKGHGQFLNEFKNGIAHGHKVEEKFRLSNSYVFCFELNNLLPEVSETILNELLNVCEDRQTP